MTQLLTLLIPTVEGREDLLARLLESLADQEEDIGEVIVACRGPVERRQPAPKALADRVKFIEVAQGGASKVRNAGWKHATGALLGFADDDCIYPPGLCRRVVRFFEAEPETDLLCGSVRDPRSGEPLAATPRRRLVLTRREVVHSCIGPAMWVRPSALCDLRFDESIGTGSSGPWQSDEEPDLVLRAISQGCRAIYDPDYLVWHCVPDYHSDWRTIAPRAFRYGMGRGHFLAVNDYSMLEVASGIGRSIVGAALFLLQGRPAKAWCYVHTFTGRIAGYAKARREKRTAQCRLRSI